MSEPVKTLEQRAAELPWDVAEGFVKALTDPDRWEQTTPEIRRGIVELYLHIPDATVAPFVAEALAERDALQAFKDFVHGRLDTAGVPTHPDGPHSAEGCRIGDRLDLLVGERDALRLRTAYLAAALEIIVGPELTYFDGTVMGGQVSREAIVAGRAAIARSKGGTPCSSPN